MWWECAPPTSGEPLTIWLALATSAQTELQQKP